MLDNLKEYRLILGSGSPRRQDLLRGLGLEFSVRRMDGVDESYPQTLSGQDVPLFLSRKKAGAFHPALGDRDLLITADTVVCLDGQIMGKPCDEAQAVAMLSRLQDRSHEVFTGVCLTTRSFQKCFVEATRVHFTPLSQEEILHYVRKFKPMDKAGAYGVQEWIGYVGVDRIEGCYYNIMGLPVQKLFRALSEVPPIGRPLGE